MEIKIRLNKDDVKEFFKYCADTIVKRKSKINLTPIVLLIIIINVISIFFHSWVGLGITLLMVISFLSIIFFFNTFARNKMYKNLISRTPNVRLHPDMLTYDDMEIALSGNLYRLIETRAHYFILFNESCKLKYLIIPKRYEDSSRFIENYTHMVCEKYQIKKELYN
ncbi:MAG TPA: hypothetical protein VHO72_15370 [Bacteroidales bacterium]|nr:hypothetical protein [Bacteroidales bacterium]